MTNNLALHEATSASLALHSSFQVPSTTRELALITTTDFFLSVNYAIHHKSEIIICLNYKTIGLRFLHFMSTKGHMQKPR